jgi:HD-GYP domain-containing protein (c-di-GMP phosphodiesterase class II)
MGEVSRLIYTVEHQLRSGALSVELVPHLPDCALKEVLEIPNFEEKLEFAAAHHDFAKKNWPDELLIGTKKTSDKEWPEEWTSIIRRHPVESVSMLRETPNYKPDKIIEDIILYHHVRYDGVDRGRFCGYPSGKIGEYLPIGQRIIKVVDAFDAMVSERAYRTNKITMPEAIERIIARAGTEYDPAVAAAIQKFFISFPDRVEEIAKLRD